MITYKNINNAILDSKGKIVTFIYDNDSSEFVESILEDLRSDHIIEMYSEDVLGNLKENSILLIKYVRGVQYKNFLEEIQTKNVLVIVLRKYNETTNTELFGSNDNAELFNSNIIFLSKSGKLKILKSRYSELDTIQKKYENIDKLVRSIKLKILDKVTKK